MFNWIIGIPLLTLFATVGLAIIVIASPRREPSRTTLNVLLLLMAIWTFCSVMLHSVSIPNTTFWLQLIMAFASCTGAVGVHFSAQFTRQMGRVTKWIVRLFYLTGAVSIILIFTERIVERAELLSNGIVSIEFAPLMFFLAIIVTGMTISAIAFLLKAIITPSSLTKQHTIVPLIGFIILCIGGLSNIFVSSYPVDIAANFICVSMLSYGVTGGHLLKPVNKLPWYLTLVLTVFLLGLCYIAILVFFISWQGYPPLEANLMAVLATIAFGLVVFGPTRKTFLNLMESWLFPDTHHHRQALSRLASLDNSLVKLDITITKALDIITNVTRAKGTGLLLKNAETGNFEVKYAAGNDIVDLQQIKIPANSPLLNYLGTQEVPLSGEEIVQQANVKVTVRGEDDVLRELDSTLYYVIKTYSGPLAILAIKMNPKEIRNEEEIKDFIKLACHQIANVVINLELYETGKREAEEHERVEEKAREAANLKELDRLRTELLANVSHELRTPLASIKGFSSMMLEYEKRLTADDKKQYMKAIDGATDRLVELIDQLLDMSRLDTGMLTLEKENINIRKLFKDVVNEARIRSKNHNIILEMAPRLPKVNADVRRVRQVIDNLISNAVNYSNPGTDIVISVRQEGSELLTSVADHGIGIPEGDQPRLFERMFRSKKKRGSGVGGAGLGLAICKGLVEAHGGKIWIESKEGEGTTCLFTLPIDGRGNGS